MMAPALAAVGTYALLLAWNEYLYQFLLLSSKRSMTVPVALAQFLNSDEAPWNYMMATAIVYALPPLAIYLRISRPHDRRADDGWRQGLARPRFSARICPGDRRYHRTGTRPGRPEF